MGLPTTITAGSVVFDNVSNISGSSVIYYAPSPQGDLEGRPTLRVSHESTKAGIRRSLISLQKPIYNGTLGKYTGFEKADFVLNRPENALVANSELTMEQMATIIALETVQDPVTQGLV
jgi:hypothetical protein